MAVIEHLYMRCRPVVEVVNRLKEPLIGGCHHLHRWGSEYGVHEEPGGEVAQMRNFTVSLDHAEASTAGRITVYGADGGG